LKEKHGSRRTFYVTLVFVIVVVVAILVFNRHGLIALAELKGNVDVMAASIDSLRNEIDSLQSEIEKLKNDSLYLERMVREILGWGREGEHIIRFLIPGLEGGPP
jgi:cell division protein FtsB